MKKFKLFPLVVIFIFTACNEQEKKPDIETKIAEAINKYPQLAKTQGKINNTYKLVRGVTLGESGIELQLYSQSHKINDYQQIVLVINAEKKVYALPFFSNTYHDYWQFPFDSFDDTVKPTNTTFNNELKNCFEYLKVKDTLRNFGKVIEELFLSLLQCQRIGEKDTSELREQLLVSKYNLPEENSDSCDVRIRKNLIDIQRKIKEERLRGIIFTSILFDRLNKRIYTVNYRDFPSIEKSKFNITAYREDCNTYNISL